MGRFKYARKPFEGKKRKSKNRKSMESPLKKRLQDFNLNQSWYNEKEEQWNQLAMEEASPSRRKILLPEEDVNYESEVESENASDEENITGRFEKVQRNILICPQLLENFLAENFLCKECGESAKLREDVQQHHGLGTKLVFVCSKNCSKNNNGFFNTKRDSGKTAYEINKATCIAMRAIGKGRSAAMKLFSIMDLGKPVSNKTWTRQTTDLTNQIRIVAERNMKLAAEEVHTIAAGDGAFVQDGVVSAGTSFDCSWNSRGWQAKQGVVAAIAQINGKIIDVVQKISYCRECKVKQKERDEKYITSIDYLEWFINHEPRCSLNHTGSPQVKQFSFLKACL